MEVGLSYKGVGLPSSGGLDLLLDSGAGVDANSLASSVVNTTTTATTTSTSNISMDCHSDYLPTIAEYHQGLNQVGLSFAVTMSAMITLCVVLLFLDTVKHILTRVPSKWQTNTIMVLSLYPVVSLMSLSATVVPRAQFIMETVAHVMFMVTLYHMFCLVISYSGGEAGYIASLNSDSIDTKVGPCCCWPCCFFLPTLTVTKRRLKYLRALVLQAPVVQGIIYTTFLVLFSESQVLFQTTYNYMTGLVVFSVLSSIWGLVMTITPTFETLKHTYIKEKYIVFQLVLVLTKLQMFGARLVVASNVFNCSYPISPMLYVNLIYNLCVNWEMLLLCFLARKLYRRQIKTKESNLASNLPQTIAVIQDKIPPGIMNDNNNSTIVVRF